MAAQLSRELINKAMKLAKGKWQRLMLKYGVWKLQGSAATWRASYRVSLESLAYRLRKEGIPAIAFRQGYHLCLVFGDDFVSLYRRMDELRDDAIRAHVDIVKLTENNRKLDKLIRKHRLRSRLRSFIIACDHVAYDIAYFNGNAVEYLLKNDGESAQGEYNRAARCVEVLEREWEELSRLVSTLFI